MGALIYLDVIRANVWRVMQLRTFQHRKTFPVCCKINEAK